MGGHTGWVYRTGGDESMSGSEDDTLVSLAGDPNNEDKYTSDSEDLTFYQRTTSRGGGA